MTGIRTGNTRKFTEWNDETQTDEIFIEDEIITGECTEGRCGQTHTPFTEACPDCGHGPWWEISRRWVLR